MKTQIEGVIVAIDNLIEMLDMAATEITDMELENERLRTKVEKLTRELKFGSSAEKPMSSFGRF